MRLNGDNWKNDVDDDENGEEKGIDEHKLVVGYALTTKKVKSFLQPKLEGFARCILLHISYEDSTQTASYLTSVLSSWHHGSNDKTHKLKKGILFVEIDQCRPLSDQGPFDIVLHKLTGKEWQRILEDYREKHPEVTVLDPPHAIQHLLNRQSMLQDVADLNLSDGCGIVGVPKQLVISKDASSIPDAVTKAGLALPLVVKPLSAKSHELSLAYDPFSLSKLEPPVVLQEFVNHGGVLFKVYIIGETIRVVRRFSLPDVDVHESLNSAGVFRFPRVSSASASADDADLDPGVAELPPGPLLEKLARELRQRLGLCLFNIDIIREHGSKNRFYVIDINYFPGYGKMPGYEQIFTDFLLSLVQGKYKRRLSNS